MLGKQALMDRLAGQLSDNSSLQAVTGAFAALEREQRAALRDHLAALGHDEAADALADLADDDDRREQMTDALRVRLQADQGPWDLYADHLAPRDLDTVAARPHRGLDPDEWADKQEEWVALYREGGEDLSDLSDADLVEYYCRSTFGVDTETFEQEVVEFEPARVFETVIAGPFQAHTDALEAATEEVRE